MSLLLMKDGRPMVKFSIGRQALLGRSSECDLHVWDPELSRRHFQIARDEAGCCFIEDLGSKNGTFVGGVRIEGRTRLSAGDEIRAGGQVLIFDAPLSLAPSRIGDRTVLLVDDEADSGALIEMDEAPDPALLDLPALQTLYRLTADIAARIDLDALLRGLIGRLSEIFKADRGFILTCSSGGENVFPLAVYSGEKDPALSRTLVRKAVQSGRPMLLGDALEAVELTHGRSILRHGLCSVMLAPMKMDGTEVGCIWIDRKKKHAYDESDLRLLALAADGAARCISSARQVDRMRRRAAGESGPIIGESAGIREAVDLALKAAPSTARVLITGESGTGKELIARLVHENSPRAEGPFIAVNCAALPENLLESELFGHEKGAFTGAVRRRKGCFEQADGGTLFLDEIAEMPPILQARLLRALQEGMFVRLGGEQPVSTNARIIAATNRDLTTLLEKGQFREDLYFRLNVIHVHLPPLRERPGDVRLLAGHLLDRFARQAGKKKAPEVPERVMEMLETHPWPGNVRELANVLERMVVLNEAGPVKAGDLPGDIRRPGMDSPWPGGLKEAVTRLERGMIAEALAEAGGKKVAAAARLGISRPTLDKKIEEYGL